MTRLRQTARKSTSTSEFNRMYRHSNHHNNQRDEFNRFSDSFMSELLRTGVDLPRYMNQENHPFYRVVADYSDLSSPELTRRARDTRIGSLPPRQYRGIARKSTCPPFFIDGRGSTSGSSRGSPPAASSLTTETRSKQVRKRPEDEVSPGGRRTARLSDSDDAQPSTSSQIILDSQEPIPSTSTGRVSTRRERLPRAAKKSSSSNSSQDEHHK